MLNLKGLMKKTFLPLINVQFEDFFDEFRTDCIQIKFFSTHNIEEVCQKFHVLAIVALDINR